MSNLMLAYPNRVDGATVCGGLWRTVQPVANLKDKALAKLARSETAALTSTQFRVDLGVNYVLQALALVNHNLSAAAQWRMSVGAQSMDITFDSETVSSQVTATGGANGTRWDSTGTMVAAVAPRIDFSPVATGSQSSHACLGLLVEEQRSNLFLNSLLSGASLATQSVTLTAAAYTLSFYGTGTVTLTGASTAGPLVGTADTTRVSLTFTPTAGAVTFTVAGTVNFANLELGSFPTSFIPTAGALVTRTADKPVMSMHPSAYYNQTAGAFYIEFLQPSINAAASQCALSVNQGTATNYMAVENLTGTLTGTVVSGGASQAAMATAAPVAGTVCRAALAYAANNFSISKDNAAAVTDTSGLLPAVTIDELDIGWHNAFSTRTLNGYVKRIAYWNTRLSDANVQAITAATGPEAINTNSTGWLNALQLSFQGDVPANWGTEYQAQMVISPVTAQFVFVEISDTANAAGYVQAGRFFLSNAFQPTKGASYGLKSGRIDLSTNTPTPGGTQYSTIRRRQRIEQFALNWLTQAEADRIHEMQSQIGTTDEVLYIPNPTDLAISQRYGFLGFLSQMDLIDYPLPLTRATPFQMKEKL